MRTFLLVWGWSLLIFCLAWLVVFAVWPGSPSLVGVLAVAGAALNACLILVVLHNQR